MINSKRMKKTVLVVDDSESIREVVKLTLEDEGFNVITGNDGVHALNVIEGKSVDLIITDLHMPNLDGIGFIRRIREQKSFLGIPILFLTTESQLEKKMEAKDAGATGCFCKPFMPKKLLNAVNRVVR
jgi:two-component system chemotaxis response regulator CheY